MDATTVLVVFVAFVASMDVLRLVRDGESRLELMVNILVRDKLELMVDVLVEL